MHTLAIQYEDDVGGPGYESFQLTSSERFMRWQTAPSTLRITLGYQAQCVRSRSGLRGWLRSFGVTSNLHLAGDVRWKERRGPGCSRSPYQDDPSPTTLHNISLECRRLRAFRNGASPPALNYPGECPERS